MLRKVSGAFTFSLVFLIRTSWGAGGQGLLNLEWCSWQSDRKVITLVLLLVSIDRCFLVAMDPDRRRSSFGELWAAVEIRSEKNDGSPNHELLLSSSA